MPPDLSIVHRRIRDAIILNLRDNFGADSIFTYTELAGGDVDPASKIQITDVTPQDATGIKVPAVIVESVTANEMRYLSDEFVEQEKDGFGVTTSETVGTSFTANINIRLLTESTVERDQLLDKAYNFVKLLPDILAENGVAVIKTDFIPESHETFGTRVFYTSGFTLPCYVEWNVKEDVPEEETVEAVTIDVTNADPSPDSSVTVPPDF